MARASASLGAKGCERASTTTKSLPSPFIFRNGRLMGAAYSAPALDSHPAAGASSAAFALPALAETPVTEIQAASEAAPPAATDAADPFIWLEDVHGQKALAWVEAENARSLAVLKGDPRYATFHEAALKIVNAHDRIPAPDLVGTAVFNFW